MTPLKGVFKEVSEFLTHPVIVGSIKPATAKARQVALRKFMKVLKEDEKTVEYLSDNLEIIKKRVLDDDRNIRGKTVEEYAKRIRQTLRGFKSSALYATLVREYLGLKEEFLTTRDLAKRLAYRKAYERLCEHPIQKAILKEVKASTYRRLTLKEA